MDQDTQPTIVFIPLKRIVRSESNPRKRFDEGKLLELAESIKNHGVLQPILVRPATNWKVTKLGEWLETHPDSDESDIPAYELVAGERRWKAAALASLGEIPCFVRELTDRQVLEIQCVENLQRDDLNPIEEAAGYQQLTSDYGYTVEDLAARLGRSKSYVYQRLRLAGLPDEAKDAVITGAIPPSTALLIARLPAPKDREKAAKLILHPEAWQNGGQPLTFVMAKDVIERNFHLLLANAAFPVDKVDLLAGVGDCSSCPKKAGNQPELFADVRNADSCTDPKCFQRKGNAWWELRSQEAVAAGQTVLDAKEAAKHIKNWRIVGDTYLSLNDICYRDPEHRAYAAILGDDCPPVTLARDHGRIHELIDQKAALDVLARKHPEWDESNQGRSQLQSAWQEEQRKQREKRELDEQTLRLAIAAIVEAAEGQRKLGADLEFWKLLTAFLVKQCLGCGSDAVQPVLKRRQVEIDKCSGPEKAVATYLESLSRPAEVIGFCLEVLLLDQPHDYRADKEATRKFAEYFGLQMRSFRTRARAGLKKGKDEEAPAETPATDSDPDKEAVA